MSNLVDHAERELAAIRSGEADEMQDEMERCVLDIVRMFSEQEHSGFSAAYAVSVLEKLLRFEPLAPLTGADDEWVDVSDYGESGVKWEQNLRCSHVFREDGEAYDAEGIIFRDPDGSTYTSRDSRRPITFPYTPSREVVDVAAGDDA